MIEREVRVPKFAGTAPPVKRQAGRRRIPVIGQAQLMVGHAHDPAEDEADRIAEMVVRSMHRDGGVQVPDGTGRIRRSTSTPIQSSGGARLRVSRMAKMGAEGGTLDNETEQSLQQARAGGSALDGDLQRSMGETMGADLSGVRLHTGSESDSLNDQMGARAFTVGNDVFFSGGMPDAGTASGLGLIAHEVAHTVQQGASPIRREVEDPSTAPSEGEGPAELSGTIPLVEVEAGPEATMGRLPMQEDSNGRASKSHLANRGPSVEKSSRSSVTIDANFNPQSRIRQVDHVEEGGSRDEAVGRAITYGSQTTPTFPAATAFGAMQPAASFKNAAWALADGKIQIDATLFGTFEYDVKDGGRIDVATPNSPVVTAENYAAIAADLTPKLEGGSWRAARSKYWSRALTARHEAHHANDSDTWFSAEGPGIARAYLARTPIEFTDDERKECNGGQAAGRPCAQQSYRRDVQAVQHVHDGRSRTRRLSQLPDRDPGLR